MYAYSLFFSFFFCSSRRRHTRCALVTGVQTCALPILLSLTGDNLIEGVTLDGNWSNQLQTLPYYNNHTVQQIKGSLTVKGVRFRRSFASAIRIDGASLTTDADCRFVEGATHDNDVDNPRISHYIACYADAETSNQVISINGGVFIGPS